MSDPQWQVSRRRRSPFPGHYSANVWETRCIRDDHSPSMLPHSKTSASSISTSGKADDSHSSHGLDIEQVKAYLLTDRELLKSLVIKHVSREDLVKIIARKRKLEKATNAKPQVLVYTEGPQATTKGLVEYFVKEAKKEASLANNSEKWNISKLYRELGKVIHNAVQADCLDIYVANMGESTIKSKVFSLRDGVVHPCSGGAQEISCVAKFVAKYHESVLVEDVISDRRFDDLNCLSLICLPIFSGKREFLGAIEVKRNCDRPPFTEQHFQTANAFNVLMTVGIQQVIKSENDKRKRNLYQFLLEVTMDMFGDVTQYIGLVGKIMTHAKDLVGAERCIVQVLDKAKRELIVELVDKGKFDSGAPTYYKPNKPIRYQVNDTCLSGVVMKDKSVVIKNTGDQIFACCCEDIENLCEVKVKNLVCMPILCQGAFIGLFLLVNKNGNGVFDADDIDMLEAYQKYFSLALNYSKLYAEMELKENCADIAIEQLQCQAMIQDSGMISDLAFNLALDTIPDDFESHLFVVPENMMDKLSQLFVYMVKNLFGEVFNENKLLNFTETVRRNYRAVPYHNWEHAFYVTHTMYLILKDQVIHSQLGVSEAMALLIACICHDLDHRGYNNKFFEVLDLPMAALYSTSIMEQHHFQTTVLILQQESNSIFELLPEDKYKEMLEMIRHAIISTDLGLFFGNNKPVMEQILRDNIFNFNMPEHRDVTTAVMMTASDLCNASKPWVQQVKNVKSIYDEFYIQGDVERERGNVPIPMMDRENKAKMADQQTGFMKFVCIPLYTTLGKVIPLVCKMAETVEENWKKWERVGQGEDIPPWDATFPSKMGISSHWVVKPVHTVKSLIQAENILTLKDD